MPDRSSAPTSPASGSLLRRIGFAMVPIVLLVTGLELVLRLADFDVDVDVDVEADDALTRGLTAKAWVMRRDRHIGPLFVASETPGMLRTGETWRIRGAHDQELSDEPQGTLRLVALGGLTTAGVPFDHLEQGFPERLGGRLAEEVPQRRWEFINAGVPGMDSRGFPDIARQAVQLGAHGLIVYAGHNEQRGTLLDACTSPTRLAAARAGDQVATVRAGRALYRHLWPPPQVTVARLAAQEWECMMAAARLHASPTQLASTVPRQDSLQDLTVASFRANLQQVVATAKRASIPVWLGLPAANLTTPPSVARVSVGQETAKVRAALTQGQSLLDAGDAEGALAAADELLAALPGLATASHLRGLALRELGQTDAARQALELAIDLDWPGRRATTPLRAAVQEVCDANPHAVTCVDVHAAFHAAATDGIPDGALFDDFCHPTFEAGVDLLAETYLGPIADWAR